MKLDPLTAASLMVPMTISEKLQQLHNLVDQMGNLLKEKALWQQINAQGIDPDKVMYLTFLPEFLTYPQRQEIRKAGRNGGKWPPPPFENMFNAVHMQDGTDRKLDPMLSSETLLCQNQPTIEPSGS